MVKSIVRICGALAFLAACGWVAIQYSDLQVFERRNPKALAFCRALRAGTPAEEAASRARAAGAIAAPSPDHVVIRFPHESPCFAKATGGKIESAAVVGNF